MNCPVCGEPSGVVATRRDCEAIYRYRKCKVCGYLFYTTETESGSDDFNRLNMAARRESRNRKKRSTSL